MLVGEGGVAGCCFVKVTHPPYNSGDGQSIIFAAPSGRRSWDRCVQSARLLLRGGWHRSRQGSVRKLVGPAFRGQRYLRDEPRCFWQGQKAQMLPQASCSGLLWQAAGFRTFFSPTRRCVSAPLSVTLLSYLRGNPELLVEG